MIVHRSVEYLMGAEEVQKGKKEGGVKKTEPKKKNVSMIGGLTVPD